MKRNKNIIYIVIFALLLGLVINVFLKNKNSTLPEKDKNFAIKDTSTVTKIFLADMKVNSVTLEKVEGYWLVNGKFPADKSRISMLLEAIGKIQVRSIVPEVAKNTVIRDLASKAVKIEIYNKKKKIKAYFVGSETPDVLGTYMMLDKKHGIPFVMYIPGFEGYLTPRYFADESEWRSKIVFNFNPVDIKSVDVNYTDSSEKSFQLIVIDEKTFKITSADKEEIPEQFLNLPAIKHYLLEFSNIQFIDMIRDFSKAKTDSILNSLPVIVVSVTGKSGKTQNMKLYYRHSGYKTRNEQMPGIDAEYYYAEASDRPGEIGIMQTLTLQRILWKISDFKKKK